MSLEQWWHEVVSGHRRDPAAGLTRGLLTCGSGLYWLGLQANLSVYRLGLKRPTRAALPVISVGNITLGGTGKSTAVRFLARELQARGVRPGVVLRGHGRADSRAIVLASDGRGQTAPLAQTGDEAAEVARALPDVPVAVGKRRERVIALLAQAGAQVALLDDGYQYFRMARELNIALVSARLDPGAARLFPRGALREPWGSLQRADQVWLTHADHVAPEQLAAVRALIVRHAPGKPLVVTTHEPRALVTLAGAPDDCGRLAGQVVLAVSGLGCPESFEHSLTRLGARVVPLRFSDHYRYGPECWAAVQAAAEAGGAAMVVTTEKDAVKMPPQPPLPVWVLRSELALSDGAAEVGPALDQITAAAVGGS